MKRLLAAVLVGFLALPAAAEPRFTVTWSDADSGTLIGDKQRILFRLHDIDAPETWSRNAKCEREIELGYLAKEAAVKLTTGADLDITAAYGFDHFARLVIDLSAGGKDVGKSLIASGHVRTWDYDGGQAKPLWCGKK
ncbi:COG1525 Micrococcal nuclease (thermonuclease) homologs [uncultured Caudovirales phage]|uniref:COG1525 Micrococcal nuclease (Thermonuclease) homologs n=1 Tax=uncultured Caudovirales phage TaxID=2100421 RepID=A0A6J5M3T6_9CAUD|nr:COG1525 Micrococcal nuclease (thermonuclease) homologs [uncultured Caudovirales phage]